MVLGVGPPKLNISYICVDYLSWIGTLPKSSGPTRPSQISFQFFFCRDALGRHPRWFCPILEEIPGYAIDVQYTDGPLSKFTWSLIYKPSEQSESSIHGHRPRGGGVINQGWQVV